MSQSHSLLHGYWLSHSVSQPTNQQARGDLEVFCDDQILADVEANLRRRSVVTSVFYFGVPMLVMFVLALVCF